MRIQNALTVLLICAPVALAQSRLDFPTGKSEVLRKDSGLRANTAFSPRAVYQDQVRVPNADWIRLYFGNVQLAPGSRVRLTSLRDGEIQELDAAAMAQWGKSSAYFNGDTVVIELIAAPRSLSNRVIVERVDRHIAGEETGGCGYPCGICGLDDREPSSENWVGRLLPAGCTATVYNMNSCLVSAGHCIEFWQNNSVIQFNVPPSNPNCSLQHPPIADQFPITSTLFENEGLGADWAVMTTGSNVLGETIMDRFREFRPITTGNPGLGQHLTITGYGIDPVDCQNSQTQQTSEGLIADINQFYIRHSVDATCGNSGSSILRNGEIIAIASHCPCPNFGTRVDKPAFAAARANLCPGGTDQTCGAGDCCAEHASPGCGSGFCCDEVCACDPFCCFAEWDEFCAGQGFGDSGCGAAALCGVCGAPPPNDACAQAAVIGNDPVIFETLNAASEGPVHEACDFGTGDGGALPNDVWFEHTAACNGTLTVSTCNPGTEFNTKLAIYSGCGCPVGEPLACNDDGQFCPEGASLVTAEVSEQQCYTIRVGGAAGAVGLAELNVTCTPGECMTVSDCDDDNVCTVDFCTLGKCFHNAIFAVCEDGNACTVNDTCVAGVCSPGAPRLCGDANPCTDDFCDPASGCINDPNIGPCSDGNPCTTGDVCSAANCLPGQPTGYGDLDHDDDVDLLDIICALDGFSGRFDRCQALDMDIAPCSGDDIIDLLDISAVLDAFQGIDPCCGG